MLEFLILNGPVLDAMMEERGARRFTNLPKKDIGKTKTVVEIKFDSEGNPAIHVLSDEERSSLQARKVSNKLAPLIGSVNKDALKSDLGVIGYALERTNSGFFDLIEGSIGECFDEVRRRINLALEKFGPDCLDDLVVNLLREHGVAFDESLVFLLNCGDLDCFSINNIALLDQAWSRREKPKVSKKAAKLRCALTKEPALEKGSFPPIKMDGYGNVSALCRNIENPSFAAYFKNGMLSFPVSEGAFNEINARLAFVLQEMAGTLSRTIYLKKGDLPALAVACISDVSQENEVEEDIAISQTVMDMLARDFSFIRHRPDEDNDEEEEVEPGKPISAMAYARCAKAHLEALTAIPDEFAGKTNVSLYVFRKADGNSPNQIGLFEMNIPIETFRTNISTARDAINRHGLRHWFKPRGSVFSEGTETVINMLTIAQIVNARWSRSAAIGSNATDKSRSKIDKLVAENSVAREDISTVDIMRLVYLRDKKAAQRILHRITEGSTNLVIDAAHRGMIDHASGIKGIKGPWFSCNQHNRAGIFGIPSIVSLCLSRMELNMNDIKQTKEFLVGQIVNLIAEAQIRYHTRGIRASQSPRFEQIFKSLPTNLVGPHLIQQALSSVDLMQFVPVMQSRYGPYQGWLEKQTRAAQTAKKLHADIPKHVEEDARLFRVIASKMRQLNDAMNAGELTDLPAAQASLRKTAITLGYYSPYSKVAEGTESDDNSALQEPKHMLA